MNLPTLPIEIVGKIAALMGEDRLSYLGPLLRAGKEGRDIVYKHKIVLEKACIYLICIDGPAISIGGRNRTIFARCLDMGNPISAYYEGIRVCTQDGDIDGGLKYLNKIVHSDVDASLATSIFSICVGNRITGGIYLDIMSKFHHVDLKSDEVEELGRCLLIDIGMFNPRRTRRYLSTIEFPLSENYTVPYCFGSYNYYFGACFVVDCPDCYIWTLANKISLLL